MYSFQTTPSKHLDSVFLFEGLDSIRKSGVADSATVSSVPIISTLFNLPPEAYCASPLAAAEAPYHILDNHAYLALYLLAVPSYFMTPEAVMALVNTLAHLVLLFLPYIYLRWRRVSMLHSVVVVACVGTYSTWSLSFIGDYYMDRVYMLFVTPVLFAAAMLITAGRASRPAIAFGFICALCAALCTERGAIMVAGLMCFYLLFYRAELKRKGMLSLIAACMLLLAIYAVVYILVFYKGTGGGSGLLESRISGLQMLWDRLASPGGQMLVVVNLLPLGVLAVFSGYRYGLLAACALLPNLLFNAGGSELNGWTTHYHAMYMPFLVFAACIGYERVVRWAERNKASSAWVGLTTAAGALAAAAFLDPYSGFARDALFTSVKTGIFGSAWTYYINEKSSRERIAVDTFRAVAEIVPPGATVSATEQAMPSLYVGRELPYFPLGLDTSQYLVIAGTAAEGKLAGPRSLGSPTWGRRRIRP